MFKTGPFVKEQLQQPRANPGSHMPTCADTWLLPCMQVVMGEEVPQPVLERLSSQFAILTMGLVAWPYLDLPFTPWRK